MSLTRFAKKEFVGAYLEVLKSYNKNCEGIKGIIVDETKNMLIIQANNGLKKLIKHNCVFEITFNDNQKFTINGNKITYRPEDRIKKIKGV